MSSRGYNATLLMAPDSGKGLRSTLHLPIIRSCQNALSPSNSTTSSSSSLSPRRAFTIALSGGSLPSVLKGLGQSFQREGVDPQWDKWHILLADERCVTKESKDSNLGSIEQNFTSVVPVPKSQIYGIDEGLLGRGSSFVAKSYEENVVKPLLEKSGGMLDCVVLGFGPDGHTCSLFPGHPLLHEDSVYAASIDDSPKPPPSRITLTFPLLNKLTRQIIFCGAGASKSPILRAIFGKARPISHPIENAVEGAMAFEAPLNDPAPYPCGMVRPSAPSSSLLWVVDSNAAVEGITVGGYASYHTKLLLSPSKSRVGDVLAMPIVESCRKAIQSRGVFTIALSGGSLPAFLRSLPEAFRRCGVPDPQWDRWHVLLADERCVEATDADSNLGAIHMFFTNDVPIPPSQVYGIEEALIKESSMAVAKSYESNVVRPLLDKSGGMLDCAVLGFGPDGHTCSLFPGHPLLHEDSVYVASIDDSPKPPPSRITLTFPILNKLTRQIIFCGAGASKSPILRAVFGRAMPIPDPVEDAVEGAMGFRLMMNDPAPYPCGMVRTARGEDSLVWVVDAAAAAEGISVV